MGWEELRNIIREEEGIEVNEVNEAKATIVFAGRNISIPAPVTAGEILSNLGGTPADTAYIVVSETGRKLNSDEVVEPGDRVFVIPVRIDG